MANSAAKCCKWGGRILFFALIATQGGFLAAYPAQYKENSLWYVMTVSYSPTILLWICLMVLGHADLLPFFYVWAVYICCALLPNIILIFGFVVNDLDKDGFHGPDVLKMVLCITPLLLLLLLNTAEDSHRSERRRELVSKLSVQMAIDLFDTVEILDIVLEDKEHNYGISEAFGIAMVVVACFSFFLSPWQMFETRFIRWGEHATRFKMALVRNIVEMVFVNLAFMIIRVWVFAKYGKDESIFIAKNFIAIILSVFQIYHIVRSR